MAALPRGIPQLFFKKASEFYKILMVSGHGSESAQDARYKLKLNQYAMIPGKCGTEIKINVSIYDKFFKLGSKKFATFNKNTKNKDVSSAMELEYKTYNKSTSGNNINLGTSSDFKIYHPGIFATYKTTVPQLLIQPIVAHQRRGIDDGKEYLTIELSGILDSENPVPLNYSDPVNANGNKAPPAYDIHRLINDGDLEKPFSEIDKETLEDGNAIIIRELIRRALQGSVIPYEDILILALMYKYGFYKNPTDASLTHIKELPFSKYFSVFKEIKDNPADKTDIINSLTIKDILDTLVPIEFFYDYLDNLYKDTSKPYLLIVMTCRDILKLKEPNTPNRLAIHGIKERRRRQSSVNTESLNGLPSGNMALPPRISRTNSLGSVLSLSQSPSAGSEAAGGGGGGGGGAAYPASSSVSLSSWPSTPTVGLSGLGFSNPPTVGFGSFGGYRRTTRRRRRAHQKRRKTSRK